MDTIFISDDGVKDDTFIKVAGEYAEGVYATGPKDTSKNPMAIAAIEAHKKKYGADPGRLFPQCLCCCPGPAQCHRKSRLNGL